MNKGGIKLDNGKECNYVIGMKDNFNGHIYRGHTYINSYPSYNTYFDRLNINKAILNSMPNEFSGIFKNHIKEYNITTGFGGVFNDHIIEKTMAIDEVLSMYSSDNILNIETQFEFFKNNIMDSNCALSDFKYCKSQYRPSELECYSSYASNGNLNWSYYSDYYIDAFYTYNLRLYGCI